MTYRCGQAVDRPESNALTNSKGYATALSFVGLTCDGGGRGVQIERQSLAEQSHSSNVRDPLLEAGLVLA
jgi:hypothetical protein